MTLYMFDERLLNFAKFRNKSVFFSFLLSFIFCLNMLCTNSYVCPPMQFFQKRLSFFSGQEKNPCNLGKKAFFTCG